MKEQQNEDRDLGKPGEIRQYEHTEIKEDASADRGKNDSEDALIHTMDGSTLQTTEEYESDKNKDPRFDESVDINRIDQHETKVDHLAGSDRAGTAERRDNYVMGKPEEGNNG